MSSSCPNIRMKSETFCHHETEGKGKSLQISLKFRKYCLYEYNLLFSVKKSIYSLILPRADGIK